MQNDTRKWHQGRKLHEQYTDMNMARKLQNDTKTIWKWHANDTTCHTIVQIKRKLLNTTRKRIDTNMALKFHTQNANMIRTWSLVCHVLVICVSLLCNVLDFCAFVIFVQCSCDVLCYFGVIFMSFLCVILDAGLPIPCCSQCYLPGRITATADHRELPCS